MSQENMEIVRRLIEAVNRGAVEEVLRCMDPEVEFIPKRAAVQGVYNGHEGVREYLADTAENFDLYRVDNEEIRDLGDRVLVFDTLRLRGRESGVEVTTPTAIVLTFRNGKIARFEDFGDKSRALEAVGLSE
jgi:ketosteroid isomerase-like protein